jgi:hypothetical protein
MRRLAPIALTLAIIPACVIYETEGENWEEDIWQDESDCPFAEDPEIECPADDAEEPGDDDPGDDNPIEEDPPPNFDLSLNPDEAEQGDLFIATLTAEGELDVGDVSEVFVNGDIDLLVTLQRQGEVVFVMEVDEQAETGGVDMILELENGTIIVFDAALTIYEAGSGHSIEDCE